MPRLPPTSAAPPRSPTPAPPRVHQAYGHLPADTTTNNKSSTNSDGKMSRFGIVMLVFSIATIALVTAAVVGSSDFGSGWQLIVAPMTVTTAWLSAVWWVFYFMKNGFRSTFGRVALQVGILLETATFVGSGLLLGSLTDTTSSTYVLLAVALALKGLAWTGGHVGVHDDAN